ncbi:MAG: DUF4331 domain-containing protein, partial [Candidatus Saccharimonadales bacterium]
MSKLVDKKLTRGVIVAILIAFVGTISIVPLGVYAASHREAPLTSGDPKVDGTDFYSFVSPDKPDTVTFIANYSPFQNPPGGPNFYSFGDNAQYDINIDNNGDAKPDITYRYTFKTTVGDGNTFLYNTGAIKSLDDPTWNIKQTYTLTKITADGSKVLGENIPTPPSNIGPTSTPNYDQLQQQAIKDVNGVTTFAGQSDDPFFADLGGLFDLLTIRKVPGNNGGGSDGLKGFSVQSIALQVPIKDLTNGNTVPTDAKDPAAVVGSWTTAARQTTRVLGGDGTSKSNGKFVQVSRLGAPLVNEVVAPLAAKDLFNSSKPVDDAQFANAVTNPELGTLLNKLYDVKVPPQGKFGSAEARDDLVAIYLTGIPDLTAVKGGVPSEQLRLNVAVPVTKNPNRLGVLAEDNQGFPNGRRLADDVTDISIQAVAGAAYPIFHPDFKADPLATQLGDGVDSNDKPFRNNFPYLALPESGFATTSGLTNQPADENGVVIDDSGISTTTAVLIGLGALVLGMAIAMAVAK